MRKFLFTFFLGWFAAKRFYRPETVQFLEQLVAKLELQRDILKHDNPDLR